MRVRAFLLERVPVLPPPAVLGAVEEFNPWLDLEWEQHPEAMQVVADHPEGMTLEQIGAKMGITRERVRQIEASALEKLRAGLGSLVIACSNGAIAIPDCGRCGRPFVRRGGRDTRCEECARIPKRRRAPH